LKVVLPSRVVLPFRVVLDTNIWLDWLVFADPGLAPLRAAFEAGRIEIFIDEPCEAELARVLGYPLQKRTLDAAKQAACLAECRRIAKRIVRAEGQEAQTGQSALAVLPKCRDADDQKFLEAAAAAGADVLVTKDGALLDLARAVEKRGLPFRIAKPGSLRF
jgi:putative PIN family toxin of toxin-antitoxin system